MNIQFFGKNISFKEKINMQSNHNTQKGKNFTVVLSAPEKSSSKRLKGTDYNLRVQ